jgi:hypothetical protein
VPYVKGVGSGNIRFVLSAILFLTCFTVSFGQILDDTTKLIYGPGTTLYTYEENIKYNDPNFMVIDTSIIDIHRYSHTEESEYKTQDLGVIGTATRGVYYKPPEVIGVRSGFEVYNIYFRPVSDFKYYDTKSPYSRIGAAIGGNGRSRVDVGFNRSDSANFNVGFDYNRMIADKQVNSIGRHDRLSDSEGFDAYMVYHTRNNRYLIMGNFSRVNQTVIDQGGIDTTGGFSYFDEQAGVFLSNASSGFKKRNIHLYHQYKVHQALQFFQSFDRTFEESGFKIPPIMTEKDSAYFGRNYISEDSTEDVNSFATTHLQVGVKGTIGKLFYLGYYKLRNYNFSYAWGGQDTLDFSTTKPQTEGLEHYIGGRIRLALNEDYRLKGQIDFNLNGNQRLSGDLIAKDFDAHLIIQQYEPTFMQRAYLGNHDAWNNNFQRISTLYLEGGYRVKWGNSHIRPKATFSTITGYVYFNKQAEPEQVNGTTTLIIPGLEYKFQLFRHIFISGDAIYSMASGAAPEAIPMPQLMLHANVYYNNVFFNGHLEVQGGIDNHWQSDYFAPDYRPSTNQYFIQDNFNIPSYLIADAYLNIKLTHAYVFAKMNNLVQAVTREGYFTAPHYVGKRALFDFGFYWIFFD